MSHTVYFVDAFTHQQFKGNSAAVMILDSWMDEALMQAIATENNLSETAFVVAYAENAYDIRWFSPIKEIDFCGHATLATAFILFHNDSSLPSVGFRAPAVGEFQVEKLDKGFIQMDFPCRPPSTVEQIPDELLEGLSIPPKEVFVNQQAYFAVYDNQTDVLQVEQNQTLIKRLGPHDVVVTAPGDEFDFVSRYFWPASGGDEDPVTGSIHAGLAPFWAERLGKDNLKAFQASERGGYLTCEVKGDRVLISGQAVLYLEGEIHLC